MSDLLPPNSTALERSIAGPLARIQAIPAPIDATVRPLDVTASFLPFIGWGRSVDVWDRRWSTARQRAVVERAIALHRIKGTETALREHLRYAGGEVLEIERRPMTVFSGASLTREERERSLAMMPQVRVWRMRDGITAPALKAFHGGYHHPLFVERHFATPSTALARLRRRARWVVDGIETDVRVGEFGSWFRLHFRGTAGLGVFAGRPAGGRYFVPSEAWRRLVTIAPRSRLAWRSPVGPSLEAATAEPELIRVPGTRGRSVFSGLPARSGYYVPSRAAFRVYSRFAIHDGRRRGLRRPAVQIMGVGRYGFPAHVARAQVSVPGRRSRFAAGAGIAAPKLKYWMPHDPTPLQTVLRAGQAAKRLSDRIMLDIGPRNRFIAGRPFIADKDSFVIGRP